ncbi:MAG: hypothetical protein KGI54_13525 [Pseudomonadota bacterium]|nr:hypothetical protein [Pseudomonadota bacterium]
MTTTSNSQPDLLKGAKAINCFHNFPSKGKEGNYRIKIELKDGGVRIAIFSDKHGLQPCIDTLVQEGVDCTNLTPYLTRIK